MNIAIVFSKTLGNWFDCTSPPLPQVNAQGGVSVGWQKRGGPKLAPENPDLSFILFNFSVIKKLLFDMLESGLCDLSCMGDPQYFGVFSEIVII